MNYCLRSYGSDHSLLINIIVQKTISLYGCYCEFHYKIHLISAPSMLAPASLLSILSQRPWHQWFGKPMPSPMSSARLATMYCLNRSLPCHRFWLVYFHRDVCKHGEWHWNIILGSLLERDRS